MHTILRTTSRVVLASALALVASPALAEPLPSVARTTWTVELVQEGREPETLVIDAQFGPGAPGNATCRGIRGTIERSPIHGWYCPESGQIHFLHLNRESGVPMRSFNGTVLEGGADGAAPSIRGTMMVEQAVFGDLGEYDFSAVEQR